MNEYKTWSKDKLKDYGIKLAAKVYQARVEMRQETDLWTILAFVSAIHDAEYTLEVLRKHYKTL